MTDEVFELTGPIVSEAQLTNRWNGPGMLAGYVFRVYDGSGAMQPAWMSQASQLKAVRRLNS